MLCLAGVKDALDVASRLDDLGTLAVSCRSDNRLFPFMDINTLHSGLSLCCRHRQ